MIKVLKKYLFSGSSKMAAKSSCRYSASEMDEAIQKVVNKAETLADIRINLNGYKL